MLERTQVLICGGTGCMSSKSKEIKDTFENVLLNMGIKNEVGLVLTGCFGLCEKGPVIVVYPEETFYSHVTIDDVEDICYEHLLKGRPLERLMIKDPVDKKKIKNMSQLKFYSKQRRIALRNCGNINPLDITEYIAKDGYMALAKVVTQMSSQEVVDEMIQSGLRGRGGGGFLTGKKWQFAKNSVSDKKICHL